jgi:dipeptidyl aminopeptidase/acylaminoacyl peptidase
MLRALLALLLLSAAPALAREAAHPTAEEVVSLASAADLTISPDGTHALFVRTAAVFDTTAKPSADDATGGWSRDRQLWIVDVASGAARALTQGKSAPSGPTWSPDGSTIAFVRREGGHAKLLLLPLAGGEPRVLDTGKLEPGSPQWSPDGRTLAFLAESPPTDAETRARWARGGAIPWGEDFVSQRLWTVPAAGGTPRAVSAASLHVSQFAWAPDGKRFELTTSASSDPYVASSESSVRVVGLDGREQAALPRPPGSWGTPAWSPDGRSLALLALNGGLSNLNAILVWEPASGRVRDLAPDAERTFGAILWSGDGASVIAVVRARTVSQLVRFPLAGAPAPIPFSGRVVTSGLVGDAAARKIAFLSSTDRAPDDVTVLDLPGGALHVVTTLNPQAAGWTLAPYKRVHWKNAEGVALEGLLAVSPAARPGAPAPLIVMPHGGPDDVSAERFSGLVQYFAARGYSVFRPNYRGGVGYGFAHYAANRNRFGEIEQADIESGVDALIASGDAAANKLYFGGWSWGGYLTAWTIGHVHRYRAAVAGAAVSDAMLQYSLSDINHGAAAQWEYQGDPWRQLEHFDRPNPIRYAKDIRTPTLILHGQADGRVGFPESVQLYRALADLGVEVKFWAYPREDHGFVEPAHLVHYFKLWADWYDAHARPETAATPANRTTALP